MNKIGLAGIVLSAVMGTTGMTINSAQAQDNRGNIDVRAGEQTRSMEVRIYDGKGRPYCTEQSKGMTCYFPDLYLREQRLEGLDASEANKLCTTAMKRDASNHKRSGLSQWLHSPRGRNHKETRQDIDACAYQLNQMRDKEMRPYLNGVRR